MGIELIPVDGTTVQVDCATSLQTLQAEYEEDESILKRLNIKIDLGRTLNKNKSPVAENAVKEFHKERLRLNPAGGPISEIDRALITKNMNSRNRDRGFSSKEIAFQRDQMSNNTKSVSGEEMSSVQYQNRKKNHPKKFSIPKERFKLGDNVFLKNDKSKLRGRENYKVVKIFMKDGENWAKLQKSETQFRSKEYLVKWAEIFHVPVPALDTENGTEVLDENAVPSVPSTNDAPVLGMDTNK